MEIKTFQNTYNLGEFQSYITQMPNDDCINVVEITLDTDKIDNLDYIKEDFSHLFVVETPRHSYVFSGYEVEEYFIDDEGLVKVKCVK